MNKKENKTCETDEIPVPKKKDDLKILKARGFEINSQTTMTVPKKYKCIKKTVFEAGGGCMGCCDYYTETFTVYRNKDKIFQLYCSNDGDVSIHEITYF
jgi:hypothetical protein